MTTIQSITQRIIETDYGWDKPSTLVILVPVISLIFLSIKASHIENTLQNRYQTPEQLLLILEDPEYEMLNRICKWHAAGCMVQMITFVALCSLNLIFVIPFGFAVYEAHSAYNGILGKFSVEYFSNPQRTRIYIS